MILIVFISSTGLSSHVKKDIYLITSYLSSLMNLCLLQMSSNFSISIFLLFGLIFNNTNNFLNWIKVELSKQSYSSNALCLYLFNTNLFTVPLPSFKYTLEIRVNKLSSLFSSLLSFRFSSSWDNKSCIPCIAPFLSILLSILYFIKHCHKTSFSSSVFHISYNSTAFKKSSSFSKDNNSLLFDEKYSSIFSLIVCSNKSTSTSSCCSSDIFTNKIIIILLLFFKNIIM